MSVDNDAWAEARARADERWANKETERLAVWQAAPPELKAEFEAHWEQKKVPAFWAWLYERRQKRIAAALVAASMEEMDAFMLAGTLYELPPEAKARVHIDGRPLLEIEAEPS